MVQGLTALPPPMVMGAALLPSQWVYAPRPAPCGVVRVVAEWSGMA